MVVILQQQTLSIEPAKQLAADGFVTSLGQPPAALIAASNVKAKSHIAKPLHRGVVEFDAKR